LLYLVSMGILEALVGGIAGSGLTAAIALADNRRRQRERIAREAKDEVNLSRDLGHIKRDLATYAQAFELIRNDLEADRRFLRKLVARLAPDLLDDVL
jgi:hypothetical protein